MELTKEKSLQKVLSYEFATFKLIVNKKSVMT